MPQQKATALLSRSIVSPVVFQKEVLSCYRFIRLMRVSKWNYHVAMRFKCFLYVCVFKLKSLSACLPYLP